MSAGSYGKASASGFLNMASPETERIQTLEEAVRSLPPGQMGRYTVQKPGPSDDEGKKTSKGIKELQVTELEKRKIENTPPAVAKRRNARKAEKRGVFAASQERLKGVFRGKAKGDSMSPENREKRSEAAKAARKDLPAPSASRAHGGNLPEEDEDAVMSRANRMKRKEAAQAIRSGKENKIVRTSAFRLSFDDEADGEEMDFSYTDARPSRRKSSGDREPESRREGSRRADQTRAGRSSSRSGLAGERTPSRRTTSSGRTGSSSRKASSRQGTASRRMDPGERRDGQKKSAGRSTSARNSSARNSSVRNTSARSASARDTENRRREETGYENEILIMRGAIAFVLVLLFLVVSVVLIRRALHKGSTSVQTQSEVSADAQAAAAQGGTEAAKVRTGEQGEQGETEPLEVTPVLEKRTPQTEVSNLEEMTAPVSFSPHSVEGTEPSRYIEYTDIMVDGEVLDSTDSYSPTDNIQFPLPTKYTDVQGIITFRGNNFRTNPTYGYAQITQNKFNKVWTYDTGSLQCGDAYWSGSGWTGQPLIRKWPKEIRQHMNMYDWAKNEEDLVEVIYACMDGYIHFLDLWTGKETRESMYLGWTFKGAGALDPRGYPIMYVGAGYNSDNGTARAFIINLLDCTIMETYGCEDEFSLRGSLSFFDSSVLVDAETDTLITPGENGILYLIKLNTSYDEEAGTLSINPKYTKWRYNGTRTSFESFWLGMEDSACIYEGYMFISDNGGNLWCMDLNTLQVIWAQDVLDDSNSTPVLSIEDGKLYLYISTSYHLGWRSNDLATIPVWKIDCETGEIVWQVDYECYSMDDLSGGVLSTIASGAHDLSEYIYVTVARTGEMGDGVCACIRKSDGNVMWEHEAVYAWSSPVCVYNTDGSGKVIYCSCGGKMYMLDGITGEQYDRFEFGDTVVEASPAVYEDMLVIGTRDCHIYGFELE